MESNRAGLDTGDASLVAHETGGLSPLPLPKEPTFPTLSNTPLPMTTLQREPFPTSESPVTRRGTVQALVTPLLQPRAGTN